MKSFLKIIYSFFKTLNIYLKTRWRNKVNLGALHWFHFTLFLSLYITKKKKNFPQIKMDNSI